MTKTYTIATLDRDRFGLTHNNPAPVKGLPLMDISEARKALSLAETNGLTGFVIFNTQAQ